MIKAGFCLPSNVIFVLAVIFSFFIAKILFNLTKNIGHITAELLQNDVSKFCFFSENIILRFNVFVNDVAKEFAKKSQI